MAPPAVPDGIAVVRGLDGSYLIQRTRHNGSAVASFAFTRSELQALVVEANAVLLPP